MSADLTSAMDADCLIKLTKAGLKERVCAVRCVTIPMTTKHYAFPTTWSRRWRTSGKASMSSRPQRCADCFILGYERYVAEQYRLGNLTLRQAAERVGKPLSATLDLLQRLGVSGNVSADDTLQSLASLET